MSAWSPFVRTGNNKNRHSTVIDASAAGDRSDALLHIPKPGTDDEETEQAKARRVAFRVLMRLRHGCTGRSCASEEHDEHVADLRDALMCLKLLHDPQADWLPGSGYRTKGPRKRKAEA